MRIILLRHGETVWNKENRLQGCRDIPLAPDGVTQISRTGKHLADFPFQIDTILSSPLGRAMESARIAAKELQFPLQDIIPEPLFLERSFGDGEGLTYREALSLYPDSNYPGMETLPELCGRAGRAVELCARKYPGQNILVVAHGAIIKAVLVVLSGGSIGYFDEKVWIENGSYCMLEGEPDHWKISFHNASDGYAPLVLIP